MRRRLFFVLSFIGICACAHSAPTAQVPVDLAIPPLGNADGGLQTAPEEGTCTVQLIAQRIEKSSPGCYLDTKISEGPGTLRFPCNGNGPASAEFSDQHYSGTVRGGEVTLEHDSELDWEDGCRWGTHASIKGAVVHRGEPLLRRLVWDYADRVVKGDACSGACTAHAAIEVTAPGSHRGTPEPAEPDDEDD